MNERDEKTKSTNDAPSSSDEASASKVDNVNASRIDGVESSNRFDAMPSHSATHDVFEDERAARNERRRNRRNVAIVAVVALLVFALIAILIARRAKKTEGADEAETKPTVSVRVAKAERETIAAEVSALGTITPREQATVSPKISAQIKQMALLKNKYVRAGDVIAVLESSDLQAQRREAVAALQEAQHTARSLTTGTIPQQNAQAERDLRDARANVANARALYERRRALYAQGGIALKDVEAAQLALTNAEDNLRLMERTVALRAEAINPNDRAAAEARVSQAQDRIKSLDVQIGYATIRAPISGIITDQFQFQGEYASAGAKLVQIADMSEVIVKAPFADEIAARLKTGDAAEVIPTDAPDEVMHGQVSLVSRSADPQNRTSEVWIRLGGAGGKLRPNGAAQVRITAQEHQDAVVVPVSAVTLEASNGNKGTVMTVDEANVAHETKVTTGLRAGDKIEIVEGLKGGETIVVEGNYALPDGTKVEPQEGEDKDDEGEKKDEKSDEKD
jgi:HlyD family secretion protein